MNLRPLLITLSVRDTIAKLKAYAEAHVLTEAEIIELATDCGKAISDNPNRIIKIPHGYNVTYALGQQPIGLCHHISVSVDSDVRGALPNQLAVELILSEFDIAGTVEEVKSRGGIVDFDTFDNVPVGIAIVVPVARKTSNSHEEALSA